MASENESDVKLKFFLPCPFNTNAHYTIINTETQEESPLKVSSATIYSDKEGVKMRFNVDLTEEQQRIKHPECRMYKPIYEITTPIVNNVRIPIEHVRPPKPTKKWSKYGNN